MITSMLTRPLFRWRGLLPGLLVLGFLAPVLQAQSRVGIIDLKRVFEGYYRTQQADTQLKDRASDLDKARQAMVGDFEEAKESFERLRDAANDQALAADERESRRLAAERKLVELRQIEQDVTQFDRTARNTLAEQQRRMRDRILDEIKEVVTTKAREAGLALVIDVAAQTVNETPVVLYHTSENDLTTVVLNELNSRRPVELPPVGLTPGGGR
jgi:Skp family chaperone for outer membrane proteins